MAGKSDDRNARSVRFSDEEPPPGRQIPTDELPAGEGSMTDVEGGINLPMDLSRTSVREEELEVTDEEDTDEEEEAEEEEAEEVVVMEKDLLKKRKSKKMSFAHKMARAWEVKPEHVTIEDLLGHGAYGQVFKGKWSGTDVAVKIVQEDLVYSDEYIAEKDLSDAMKVFWAEVKLMRTLSHPNVVQFLGACTRRHPRMLLMEYLPNGTLEDVFEEAHMRNRPLSLELATKYAIETAKGMAYLHHNPHRTVIHRDIKPGNLLLDRTGAIKVADFGLSKAVDESILAIHLKDIESGRNLSGKSAKSSIRNQKIRKKKPFEQRGYQVRGVRSSSSCCPSTSPDASFPQTFPPPPPLTAFASQVGTYVYMPAELFRSKSDYTSKVDVYSYAMILYELYEGRQPFQEYGANPMYAAAAAAAGARPEMHRTPKCVREIIERCWTEKAEDRPTFLEILDDLQHVDAMIKYDKSVRSKMIVTIDFCVHLLWFVLTCAACVCELFFLGKTRNAGMELYEEGRKAGIISSHSKSAFTDQLIMTFVYSVPILTALASLMFLLVPNKKIRAIRRRGPRFARRKGVGFRVLRRCCGGALEILRRVTLVSSVLSMCTVMLQYSYEEYMLDDLCNGGEGEPPPGISKSLCLKSYKNSHVAIIVQWLLMAMNIGQMLFHHFFVLEPRINLDSSKIDWAAGTQKVDETSPLLGGGRTPMSARQFYKIKREHSSDDIGSLTFT